MMNIFRQLQISLQKRKKIKVQFKQYDKQNKQKKQNNSHDKINKSQKKIITFNQINLHQYWDIKQFLNRTKEERRKNSIKLQPEIGMYDNVINVKNDQNMEDNGLRQEQSVNEIINKNNVNQQSQSYEKHDNKLHVNKQNQKHNKDGNKNIQKLQQLDYNKHSTKSIQFPLKASSKPLHHDSQQLCIIQRCKQPKLQQNLLIRHQYNRKNRQISIKKSKTCQTLLEIVTLKDILEKNNIKTIKDIIKNGI